MHNIEKSAFRRGQYVGYGGGTAWRISKGDQWRAAPLHLPLPMLYGRTLRDISAQLDKLQ
jgi:hypothetical protein